MGIEEVVAGMATVARSLALALGATEVAQASVVVGMEAASVVVGAVVAFLGVAVLAEDVLEVALAVAGTATATTGMDRVEEMKVGVAPKAVVVRTRPKVPEAMAEEAEMAQVTQVVEPKELG